MKHFITSLIALFAISFSIFAQNYTVEVSNGEYSNLEDPISLNNGLTWDDPYMIIPVGFDFEFMGTTTTELTTVGLGGLLAIMNGEDLIPILNVYNADITDRAAGSDVHELQPGSQSPISYQLEGEPGTQILKVEWQNAGFFTDVQQNGDDNTNFVNFQLWIYEGSNRIEVHHGPRSIDNPDLCFEGQTGSTMLFSPGVDADFEFAAANTIMFMGDPSEPTVIITEEDSSPKGVPVFQGIIPEGTIYSIAPESTASVSVENITSTGSLQLSPNPATAYFSLNTDDAKLLAEPIEIYSALGQLVSVHEPAAQIAVDGLARGVYFVKVGTEVKKLILR